MTTSTKRYVPFARPSIGGAEKQAVLEVLDSGWITTGPSVKTFEERFAAKVGVRHAVALNSATAGLHLALEALGVGPGDEVIVPTWTFAATAEVVVHLGARPVLVDVDPRTLNILPQAAVDAATPRTRAAIVVHIGGFPADVDAITQQLGARGVAVVEDAAHAFPSRLNAGTGRFAGTIGAAGVYSFYATKTITTGEGGMLVTDDKDIADRVRLMALHGLSADAWSRYERTGAWAYQIVEAGYKYNMSDIAAAIGVVQLQRADELLDARRAIAASYVQRLRASTVGDLLELPAGIDDPAHAWHLFIIRLNLDRLRVDRGQIIEELRDAGVGTSVHFIPLHLHPYYQDKYGYRDEDLPTALREYARAISLPIWPGMSAEDVDLAATAVERVLEAARR